MEVFPALVCELRNEMWRCFKDNPLGSQHYLLFVGAVITLLQVLARISILLVAAPNLTLTLSTLPTGILRWHMQRYYDSRRHYFTQSSSFCQPLPRSEFRTITGKKSTPLPVQSFFYQPPFILQLPPCTSLDILP